jgi:hypothetical protein
VWEQNKRFAFYFTETSLPIANAFAEDYLLEDLGNNRCKFTYTVSFEPFIPDPFGGSFILKFYEQLFREATNSLARYIQAKNFQP